METHQITQTVLSLVRETLLLPEEREITSSDLLFHDLGFTSMDMLDLIFRLEDRFRISIPEGTLYSLAKGSESDDAFQCDGILTPAGRARVMNLFHDTPPQVFPERIHSSTLHQYCSVHAIVRLVEYRLESVHV